MSNPNDAKDAKGAASQAADAAGGDNKALVPAAAQDAKQQAAALGSTLSPAEALRQCFALLLRVIDDLAAELPRPIHAVEQQTTEKIDALAQEMSHNITRFAVYLGSSPEPAAVVPVAQRLANQLTAVCCALRTQLHGAAATRQRMIVETGTKVLAGVRNLVEKMGESVRTTGAVPPHLTGAVWEQVKAIATIPQTNASAIGKALVVYVSQLKDAKDELAALKLADGDAKDKLKGGKGDDDDDDDLGGDDDDEFDDMSDGDDGCTAAEMSVVNPIRELCGSALTLLKSVYVFVLKTANSKLPKALDSSSEQVAWLEGALRYAKAVSEHNDELCAGATPPHEHKNVVRSAHKLNDDVTALAALLESHPEFVAGAFDAILVAEHKKQAAAAAAAAADGKAGGAAAAAAAAPAAGVGAAAPAGGAAPQSESAKWLNGLRTKLASDLAALIAAAKGAAAGGAAKK